MFCSVSNVQCLFSDLVVKSDETNPGARGPTRRLIRHVGTRYHDTAITVLGSHITLAQRPLRMADASFKDVPELFEVCLGIIICMLELTYFVVG